MPVDGFRSLSVIELLIFVYFTLCDVALMQQFVVPVLELWSRFRTLNAQLVDCLSCLGEPRLSQLLLGWQKKRRCDNLSGRLRRLQHAHLVLQRAAELLQEHVSPAVTFHVVYSVLGTIYSIYELLVVLMVQKKVESLLMYPSLSFCSYWLVHHVFNLLLMTLSCSILEDQEAQTAAVLCRSVGMAESAPLAEAFLLQIKHGPSIRFTASGLLPINKSLLVSAVSAVATYLVVLGQLTQ
ncbi:gustatory receptor for sugar taste 43a-like [Schistocerca gregaria]|uniref:gustatory receptor for sugar taste 43a-like n=1 Tax=Schistocerca gregaria TaxID=7010 RepID=UPI00211E6E43|nr:gustatory receptor for sugar taste 43a-like [Schistocerca gregaria]